ncbi:MAG: redoxin domain-containing protein [Planctomycetaceae bacterium]|nr:redoxin domain-containing protein [Planctomycetales bacterium]MCB9923384.1 redoxin domain-containing protein [Planctomycetaceae bacterium]
MSQWSGVGLPRKHFTFVLLTFMFAGCSQPSSETASPSPVAGTVANHDDVGSSSSVAETITPESEVPNTESAPAVQDQGPAAASVAEKPPMKEQPKPIESTSNSNTAPPSIASKMPKVALTVPELPDYVFEPHVLMSQQHWDTCLVKVGDKFPDAQLTDLKGDEHSLKEFLGEKLTVVVLWSNENRLGREQVKRLKEEVVVPFENSGTSVVAINIADPPEQINDMLTDGGEAGVQMLRDPDRALYSQVATKYAPRTYLLDADGKVLWFDIEYSRSTARELSNAIHVDLGDVKVGDS